MSIPAGTRGGGAFDEQALRRAAASLRHPLSRALLVLTFTTGLIDAVSYIGLGRVFTANMTGNVVLLAFALSGNHGLPVLAPIVSLMSFVAGASAGGLLGRRMSNRHPWHIAGMLGVEAALIMLAAAIAAVTPVSAGSEAAYFVIALLAVAMGMRNANVRRLGVPDLTTTVLTMTLTGLAAESRLGGGSGQGSIRRATSVLSLLAGALTGALLARISVAIPLAVAAGLALATLLLYVPVAIQVGRAQTLLG